jgi:hypothetical protein
LGAAIVGRLVLDFTGVGGMADILGNLSGAALAGDNLWTVSDEGRTIERLVRSGDRFVFAEQLRLDDLILDIPGGDDEVDLEMADVAGGRLWLAGSHARVRKKPKEETGPGVNPELKDRKSQRLLASLPLSADGATPAKGRALPFRDAGSLRDALAQDAWLGPFMELASKENGFDIEGMMAHGDGVLLGLRGPVIDGHAVVVSLALGDGFAIRGHALHFLDLGEMGVRDLTRDGGDVLVLAGPVGDATSPFRLHRWRPGAALKASKPEVVFSWPDTGEKPEALCPLGEGRYLVLYDKPGEARIDGGRYLADVLEIGGG